MSEAFWGGLLLGLMTLLALVIWSIRRHKDPDLHIECDWPIVELMPTLAGLTLGTAVAAVAFHAWTSGASGAFVAVGGWLLGTALLLPFFALGGMGGGDVKLMAALGAWLGPREIVWLAIYSGIAGGVLGLIVAVGHGYVGTALLNVRAMLAYWSVAGLRPVPGLTLETARTPRLAYAIPILAGTMVTLWR